VATRSGGRYHNLSLYQISMTRKNVTLETEARKQAFEQQYGPFKPRWSTLKRRKAPKMKMHGEPMKGRSKVVVITPDMIVSDNIEEMYFEKTPSWMNIFKSTLATDLKQVGGTL